MQEFEIKNKRDGENVSTKEQEEKKTITKEAEISILKQLKEKKQSMRALKIKYPEIQFETINMETLKRDLKDVNTSMHTYKEIVWGKNVIQNWYKKKEFTLENILLKSIKEEIDKINTKMDTKVIKKDITNKKNINTTPLDKYTFEEYLNEKLQRKCSKQFQKQDQYIQEIKEKSKDINDKIDFISQRHEYLRVKFNDIEQINLEIYGHTHGKSLMKLMKHNSQLRDEVYSSYKKQYEKQREAIKIKEKMLEEGTKSYAGKHITTQKYSMQDAEVQKEIEVSYQKQCDGNLQAIKSLMKMEYDCLLRKMVTKSLQEHMSLEDYRLKCTEEDFEMLNKIPGPFPFKKESNCRKKVVNKMADNVEDLILRYNHLQSDIKQTQDVVNEMKKNLKIECEYKTVSWKPYTMKDPKIHREVKISYEKQFQEQNEARSYVHLMLENPISKEEEKKSCEKILRKDEKKKKAAMKIHNTQEDTGSSFKEEIFETPSCDIFPENSDLENLKEDVKDPQIVKHLLQNSKLKKVYAAKNMKSLYKNMLFKHILRKHNDKYTVEFEKIIEKNVKWYKNHHKKLNQILKQTLEKLVIIEGKVNRKQKDLEKLEKKIEHLKTDISVINMQSSKKNTQEDKILRKTLDMPNVDRTLDPGIEDSYKTQTEDEEHALEDTNKKFNCFLSKLKFDRDISMRKELKETHKIKENDSDEIYSDSSQSTVKFDDNVEPSMTNRALELENEIQNIKLFNTNYMQEIIKIYVDMHKLQTTIKKYAEFDNIKSQVNKHEYEIMRMEMLARKTEELEKKVALWQEYNEESQKTMATCLADNLSIKMEMTTFEKLLRFKKSITQTEYEEFVCQTRQNLDVICQNIQKCLEFINDLYAKIDNRNVNAGQSRCIIAENGAYNFCDLKSLEYTNEKCERELTKQLGGTNMNNKSIDVEQVEAEIKETHNVIEMNNNPKPNDSELLEEKENFDVNCKSICKSPKSIINWPARFIHDKNVKQVEAKIKEKHDVIEIKKHGEVFEVDSTGNKDVHSIYLNHDNFTLSYSYVLKDHNIIKEKIARCIKINYNIKINNPELNGSKEKEKLNAIPKSNWKSAKSRLFRSRARTVNAAQHCTVTKNECHLHDALTQVLRNCL